MRKRLLLAVSLAALAAAAAACTDAPFAPERADVSGATRRDVQADTLGIDLTSGNTAGDQEIATDTTGVVGRGGPFLGGGH